MHIAFSNDLFEYLSFRTTSVLMKKNFPDNVFAVAHDHLAMHTRDPSSFKATKLRTTAKVRCLSAIDFTVNLCKISWQTSGQRPEDAISGGYMECIFALDSRIGWGWRRILILYYALVCASSWRGKVKVMRVIEIIEICVRIGIVL